MRLRILAVLLALCLCLGACGSTVSENSEPISAAPIINDSKSQTESSEAENIYADIPYIYWTDDSKKIETLESLQHKEILTEEEIYQLVSLLMDKAWYLCYLAYKEVPSADGDIDVVSDSTEIVKYDGTRYSPARFLPYQSTEEMRDDIYKTFEKTDNIAQHFTFVDTLYRNINERLYCSIDADGQSQGRMWQKDDAEIETNSAGCIVLKMPVQFMDDTWNDSLEVVRRNGVWTLNESYFAHSIM